MFFRCVLLFLPVASDKAGAGRGEEAADAVTGRPQVFATGGAEGGNTLPPLISAERAIKNNTCGTCC